MNGKRAKERRKSLLYKKGVEAVNYSARCELQLRHLEEWLDAVQAPQVGAGGERLSPLGRVKRFIGAIIDAKLRPAEHPEEQQNEPAD